MYRAKVFITLRESILDPAGTAVKGSLHKLGFQEAKDVRIGKYVEIVLDNADSADSIKDRIKAMCEKLLANTVMEDYRFEIEEVSK
jgi:phosphoribosylformylglycinamidine synthase